MGSIVDISEVLLDAGLSDSVTETERALANTAIKRAEAAVKRYLRYDPVLRERTEFYPQQDISQSRTPSIWEVNSSTAYQRQLATGATEDLFVHHIPIRSITSLWIDYDGRAGQRSGAFGSESLKTSGEDYWMNCDAMDDDGNGMCMDGIIRSQGLWPTVPGSVKITYMAGYSSAELHGQKQQVDASSIVEAVVDEAVRRMLKVIGRGKKTGSGWTGGPITSESLGDYSYSIDSATMGKLVGSSSDLLNESQEKLQPYVNLGYMLGG